jgi:hypothetical protein
MRLGIDLDGVVANFTQGWMDFYNRDFGASLVFEDSQRWNDVVDLTHFEDIDQFWDWSSRLDGRSLFWHLTPFPGAVKALQELQSEGHSIVILTQKPAFAVEDTREWVKREGIPASEVHVIDEKWRVDCDVYLDDGPLVLPELVRHRPDRLVCRYVRPWNTPVAGAVDVRDFVEFRAQVERLTAASHDD